MSFRLGYNTNGLAHHRFDEACRMLADLGYGGVAITPDTCHLDPYRSTEADWESARALLDALKLERVVETGARYVIDPRRKHLPSLLSRDADPRMDFYARCVRISKALGSPLVSIWSGAAEPGVDAEAAWGRLLERMPRLLDLAGSEGVRVCFEPEPGMWVDGLERYRELRRRLRRDDLMTTIDVGHLLVTEPGPPHVHLAEWASSLGNVQLDDARRGVHEHLAPGLGEIGFLEIFAELRRIGYKGLASLELSRDSHRAADVAAAAIARLGPLMHGDPP
jgi:L-ribulose-5-phosphate 3-epimerase